MYRFPSFAEWREFAVAGALQSLEIYELCAAPQRNRSLLCPKRTQIAMENRQIGKSVPRKEGREKVTGSARYVDDLTFPEMIHGVTVRSLAARGKILGIRFGDGFIVEGEYETGAQEQLYIEPQGMIARANSADGVTVWGSLQCPYYVHKALVRLFGLPKERV